MRALSVEGGDARLARGGRLEVECGVTRGTVDEGDGREGVVGDGRDSLPLTGDSGDGLPLIGDSGDGWPFTGDGGNGVPLIGGGTTRESTGSRRRGRGVTDDGVVNLRDGRAGISA